MILADAARVWNTRSMTKPSPLPRELSDAFSVKEARESGVTRDRLRSSDLVAHFHGSRMTRQPAPHGDEHARRHAVLLERCRAYVPVAPAGFAFSHVTAARLYRMPLPDHLEREASLDVATPGDTRPRRRGVIGHRVELGDTRVVESLPVIAPERCWLQLASRLSIEELIVAGDHLVRRRAPASTLLALGEVVAGAAGARGVRSAQTALGDIRAGTDSPPETRTRLILVRAGLPEPVVGYTVIDDDGYFVGTPDLAYVAERIAIEYEGEVHRTDLRVFDDDIDRRERFERAGWRVVRVRAHHLRDPRVLAERIRMLLIERAAQR